MSEGASEGAGEGAGEEVVATPVRTRDDALRWVAEGTARCDTVIDGLDDAALRGPSALPGWSRAHVVAHLAANASALRNLVRWAATGVETPMYASPEQRTADIEDGARLPAAALRARWDRESAALADGLAALDDAAWAAPVRTAQGRTLPASEIPWLRAREVMVHAVDLAAGVRFADLPTHALVALEDEVRGRRGAVPPASGALPDLVAWLTGRRPDGPVLVDGAPAAPLPPWL